MADSTAKPKFSKFVLYAIYFVGYVPFSLGLLLLYFPPPAGHLTGPLIFLGFSALSFVILPLALTRGQTLSMGSVLKGQLIAFALRGEIFILDKLEIISFEIIPGRTRAMIGNCTRRN
jgi:hypothetical protein